MSQSDHDDKQNVQVITFASFDVGIKNLALIVGSISIRVDLLNAHPPMRDSKRQTAFKGLRSSHLGGIKYVKGATSAIVNKCMLIDITQHIHQRVCKENCQLFHSNNISDWMAHVFQEIDDAVAEVDVVLVEKQPICGIISVEQSLFCHYRDKVILVNPRSMHRFYGIDCFDYEERKVRVVELINGMDIDWETSCMQDVGNRQHDIADAMCIAVFWCSQHAQQLDMQRIEQELLDRRLLLEQQRQSCGKESLLQILDSYKYSALNNRRNRNL